MNKYVLTLCIFVVMLLGGCDKQDMKRHPGNCDKQDAVEFFVSYHNKVHRADVAGSPDSIFHSNIQYIEPYGKIDNRYGTRVCKVGIRNHSYKAPSPTSVACFSFVPKTGAFTMITDLPGCCVPYEFMETPTNSVCWF